jgi:hypothetical protein
VGARDRSAPGIAAGLAGVGTFLIFHAAWIAPIWEVAPIGALLSALGGIATVGALRDVLSPRTRPWRLFAVALAWPWLLLAPGIITSDLGARADVSALPRAAMFILVAAGTGSLLGWLATGRRSAAGSCLLAALVIAIGPGHNVPLLAGSAAFGRGLALLAASFAAAAVALAAADARVARRARRTQSATSGDLDAIGTT